MQPKHIMIGNSGSRVNVEVPRICPVCQTGMDANVCGSFKNGEQAYNRIAAVFRCPVCENAFLIQYKTNPDHSGSGLIVDYSAPVSHAKQEFAHEITKLSDRFPVIYNQALLAEAHGLDELVGIGLRKSLEFLVKDFLSFLYPDLAEDIREKLLGQCIDLLPSEALKTVAIASAWIGNDFTHYTRRHSSRDISDLKNFISAVVHWIIVELYTRDASQLVQRDRP